MPDAHRVLAGVPGGGSPTPAAVLELAAGRAVTAVWENLRGGVTYELGVGDERTFVKWSPAGCGLQAADEGERMIWAARYVAVPRVLGVGDDDEGSWLATDALAGTNAVAPRWIADPATAVTALGEGLRTLHDALPVDACPWSWSVVDRGASDVDAPPVDRLVVCHGDACAPNTLLDDDGRCVGHVDLGRLGVADRWADLAVATWSSVWNYGPGYEDLLLGAYGLAPDPARTEFYRWLWDRA
jgi:kanamycin kinase